MVLGLTWGEWASIITIIVFITSLISLLFKYVVLGSFRNDLKELNKNFKMLNNNLIVLKQNIEKLDKRANEHDRRLDRHHERIKELKNRIGRGGE
ncbi:hypothetical protein EFN43_07455 [Pediococcus pentosaceus]|nr:hypothetical protein [Pediococcus pentosaceus]